MAINPPAKNFVMRDPLKVHAIGDALRYGTTRSWSKVNLTPCDGTPNPTELEVIVAKRVAELETIGADMKKRHEMPPEMTDDQITMDWMVTTVKEIWRKWDYQLWPYFDVTREPIDWFGDYVKGKMSADEKKVVWFIACYIAHYQPDMLANIHARGKIIDVTKVLAKHALGKEDIIRALDLKAANGADIHYLMHHLVWLPYWISIWEETAIRIRKERASADTTDGNAKKKAKIN